MRAIGAVRLRVDRRRCVRRAHHAGRHTCSGAACSKSVLEPIESLADPDPAGRRRRDRRSASSRAGRPRSPASARDVDTDARAHRQRARPGRAGAGAAGGAQRRAGPLERRPRAVRLRRLARPVRAAAQGRQLLPAARAPVRRPARRQGQAVHRLRRRRRQAHADPHQRPAVVLAGRPHDRGFEPVDTDAVVDPGAGHPRRADRRSGRRDRRAARCRRSTATRPCSPRCSRTWSATR